MNSNNPFFKTNAFKENNEVTHDAVIIDYNQTMTVSGTVNKSFLMIILLIASAAITWSMPNPIGFAIAGAIIGFVLVIISTFKPQLSTYLAPAYAVFEGLFIGGISAIFEYQYPGIVIQAVSCTFVTFMVCLALYKYEIVKVTDKFRSVVLASTMAIATYYLISWLFSMFTSFQPVHYGNSMISIGISAFVIVIAALNLFLDFDQIEKGAQSKLPKYMEWYGAMGLMITLVWLYIEFLRLLSKLNRK
ncbi:Bax inhibitor-1/YccA family protein [Flavobacterium sp. N1994]|uniref:Bax inhibitor-1/YccA family protein n=1 Tax=Flavobacterium sp. N1994 TaxID=2986827 RepID=UPI002221A492|nr:Bax inhibitor-1/YccA family protein [Flavobacterium sp. N1994]